MEDGQVFGFRWCRGLVWSDSQVTERPGIQQR